jgi:hypothetical protein
MTAFAEVCAAACLCHAVRLATRYPFSASLVSYAAIYLHAHACAAAALQFLRGQVSARPWRVPCYKAGAVVTSVGCGLFRFRTSPVTGEPSQRSSSSFIRTRWLHLIDFFFFIVFVAAPLKAVAAPAAPLNSAAASLRAAAAPAAPLKAAAAPLKAAAIDVRCHSCTAPDVDAPATGGLLVPRTNTLLPPQFFAPKYQLVGRWHGNACGGLPP